MLQSVRRDGGVSVLVEVSIAGPLGRSRLVRRQCREATELVQVTVGLRRVGIGVAAVLVRVSCMVTMAVRCGVRREGRVRRRRVDRGLKL